jgi:hexosaminidase
VSSHRSSRPWFRPRRLLLIALVLAAAVAVDIAVDAVGSLVTGKHADGPPSAAQIADYKDVVPAPVSAVPASGQFTVTGSTDISAPSGSPAARGVADYLAALLRPATGYALPVNTDGDGGIRLVLADAGNGGPDKQFGDEGYRLDVSDDQVTIRANQPAGLFHGVQTLRQLLPPQIEDRTKQYTSWTVPAGHIVDDPRFRYRAAGLDVARHFFTIAQVERYIDEVSLYKVNYLHLHLTDDQGWRLAIDGWPQLTSVGGATEVDGRTGGYYTQQQYRDLVAYAQARFITIIPEVDLPGHVTAALASYPALSCDGKPRQVFTGTDTGFSSLCASHPTTYTFLDDVIRQLAALTPGPYIGIGGDEAQATSVADYKKIVDHAADDVRAQGKTPWGWQEIISASPETPTVATYWSTGFPTAQLKRAAATGTKLVLAPASHTYLDQKYDNTTALGLHWAGYTEVQDAYNWDPGSYLPGVDASSVLGVEADLWTETIVFDFDIDYMAFPRLPAIAELGWSPASTHDWDAFKQRLASQGPRWNAMGINYYKSPQLVWPAGS